MTADKMPKDEGAVEHLLDAPLTPQVGDTEEDFFDNLRRTSAPPHASNTSYPTPPQSASPKHTTFPENYNVPTGTGNTSSPRASSEIPTSTAPSVHASTSAGGTPRRRSSLTARYPGDRSHHPLDTIRAEQKAANRPRRRTYVGLDTIDQLDIGGVGGVPYHHDGPYDATLLGRNLSFNSSPVAAVRESNHEALRATPNEYIRDSVERHRPLLGTASIPPGVQDRFGRVLNYKEGPNLNVEMGWRRWQGLDYHPDDIKGKGEPTFTIDRALKAKTSHRRVVSEGGIEMMDRPHHPSALRESWMANDSKAATGPGNRSVEVQAKEADRDGLRRAHTTGKRSSGVASAIRSRFGSLRRRKHADSDAA